ncbi:perakine reductase-like [Rhododendron vialii]|uniref:perakine reductase-like n=1 Tax=Rhododendron vialii TaxID=182163 RepID=UPI00265F94B5|nr:perakine reductase-like [Rhododendron vialii]
MAEVEMPVVKLGNQGLEVSKIGYGCMGLTGVYNPPVSDEDGIAVIKHAFSKGITFFDTSDIYGADHANEILVAKALKHLPRDKIQLATKFGCVKSIPTEIVVKGTAEYTRSCCEASLKRLGVDYIDLYYIHRIDKTVPIEETMGELKKLVEEGKVKYIGLSEASPNTIRRAHAVHPISAVQMEYSLLTRDIEEEIIPVCRELGIGFVLYCATARGFFGGKRVVEDVPECSTLQTHPRFSGENLERNKIFYYRIKELAKKHGCTPIQLALAWVLHQGDDMVPIPGTTKVKNLDELIGALRVKLTEEDLKEITDAVPIHEVEGLAMFEAYYRATYKFADTPPLKNSK